jgi:hypothetical protein
MSSYAYSYNREDFIGRFPTREAALREAIEHLPEQMDSPSDIYVGVIVDADPQATDHAERIIDSMARRAHVDIGEIAVDYLRHVTPAQKRELDDAVAAVITDWLHRHDLYPTHLRQVRAIAEHHPEAPDHPPASPTNLEPAMT